MNKIIKTKLGDIVGGELDQNGSPIVIIDRTATHTTFKNSIGTFRKTNKSVICLKDTADTTPNRDLQADIADGYFKHVKNRGF